MLASPLHGAFPLFHIMHCQGVSSMRIESLHIHSGRRHVVLWLARYFVGLFIKVVITDTEVDIRDGTSCHSSTNLVSKERLCMQSLCVMISKYV